MNQILTKISEAMIRGQVADIRNHINKALEENITPKTIVDKALIATMADLGDKMSKNIVFIPEIMMAAMAMNSGLELLKPLMTSYDNEPIGRVIVGTVKGDSHDIGKNLVKIMLEGSGIEVLDLGANVDSMRFVKAVQENDIRIVCLSSLLTTTMPMLADVINKFEQAGIRSSVKVMIGGAPVTQDYADKIGADGYTDDASRAAKLALSWLK